MKEQKVIVIKAGMSTGTIEDQINKVINDGWTLIQMAMGRYESIILFERPKSP